MFWQRLPGLYQLSVIGLELCELLFFPESRNVLQLLVNINDRLSQRNSLNALCYRPNCVNSIVSKIVLFHEFVMLTRLT